VGAGAGVGVGVGAGGAVGVGATVGVRAGCDDLGGDPAVEALFGVDVGGDTCDACEPTGPGFG
jgi:hypothetical protein